MSDCTKTSTGLTPIMDMGSNTYLGFDGGLYGGGSNTRPSDHTAVGVVAAASVVPRDASGNASPSGKIGFLSIGMSNTRYEFGAWWQHVMSIDPARNRAVQFVNGAQPGFGANMISDLSQASARTYWSRSDSAVVAAGLTSAQVQTAWLKEADFNPIDLQFPSDAQTLQGHLAGIARIAKARYPNLVQMLVTSRSYGAYEVSPTNPGEPYAYQTGFAVRWLVQQQIDGDMDLNYDSARGAVVAPWLSWGPYIWADGTTPRSDGLFYACLDYISDGVHPANGGNRKISALLTDFFENDPATRPWFVAP